MPFMPGAAAEILSPEELAARDAQRERTPLASWGYQESPAAVAGIDNAPTREGGVRSFLGQLALPPSARGGFAPPSPGIPGDSPQSFDKTDEAIADLIGINMEMRKRREQQQQLAESGRAEREMAAREAGLKRWVEGYNASNEGMDTPYSPKSRGSYTSGNLDGSMPAVNRELYEEDARRHRFNDDVRFGRVNPGRLARMEELNAGDDIKKLEYEAAKKAHFDRVLSETNGGKLVGPQTQEERDARLKKQGGTPYWRAVKSYLEQSGMTEDELSKNSEYKEASYRVGQADTLKTSVAAMKTRMAERAKRIKDENDRKSNESRQRNREAWLASVPRDSALGGQVEGQARVEQAGVTAAGSVESIKAMMNAQRDMLQRIAQENNVSTQQVLNDPALFKEYELAIRTNGMR